MQSSEKWPDPASSASRFCSYKSQGDGKSHGRCQELLPQLCSLVAQCCPFALFGLNAPELHCWLSSHPHCIKMLGFCFRVYVRRSQGAGTDPAKDSMPRACRHGQGLPSDLPKDSLCLHSVVIDCMFVVGKVFGMTLPKTACQGHAVVS